MRRRRIRQDDTAPAEASTPAPFSASPAEVEIEHILESIGWESGDRARASKVSHGLGVSLEALHRARLHGNAVRVAADTPGRVKLVMTKMLGEFWVSRQALETYLRQLNGLDAPGTISSAMQGRRSERERRAAIARADREAAAMGA